MSEQTPSRGGAGTADGPDPQGRPDGDDREDAVLSSPEARREAEMGAAEVGEPPEPDHARTPARVPPPVPDTVAEPMGGSARGGSVRRRIPQVLALALVWVLLWGSVSAAAIVGGLLVGLAVTAIFPLPLLPERLPFRPWKLLRLLAFLASDLVVSGIRVSMVTLRHGPRARSGIVGLPLCTGSDRTATTIVAACALSPGSFTLQIDRARRRWYVYALGLHRPGAVERLRRDMMRLQLRVIDAVGSQEDRDRCAAAVAAVAAGDTGRNDR
ncbi:MULTISPECIES: Na+/H+ antiporter subunit E [unclassified Pseudonocardia]|uniref:Na+/H+ antiporter subunit E n=1 Tax=unclassified Pseudonocardia TaxID=2619320 RepID=UPI001CF6B3FA|nr:MULTISPECIES: Na+/H+ antiporter subunit E [unclassified Pseudonocardia]